MHYKQEDRHECFGCRSFLQDGFTFNGQLDFLLCVIEDFFLCLQLDFFGDAQYE